MVVEVLLVEVVCSQGHWGLKPETLLQRVKVRLGTRQASDSLIQSLWDALSVG